MRYPASEKLEIIRIVEQSHLPAKKTLDQLGIARRTLPTPVKAIDSVCFRGSLGAVAMTDLGAHSCRLPH